MNILAFYAHPDDETMLCGGTLALLARAGASVHYLSATRGEGGEAGEPPLCERDQLGVVRVHELSCAVEVLGGKSLTFLDYVDPTVGPDNTLFAYAATVGEPARLANQIILQKNIDAVITHGSNGEYGHPAHKLTHQAARMAVELSAQAGSTCLLYTSNAAFDGHPKPRLANPDDPADWIIDVTSALDQKIAAALCHRTQHALFIRRPSKEKGRTVTVPEVIVGLESLHRLLPPLGPTEMDPVGELLQPWLWNRDVIS
jgi:LmbE family N-acetylglucosaminyl deacetylase